MLVDEVESSRFILSLQKFPSFYNTDMWSPRSVFSIEGVISRKIYLAYGVGLFGLKYLIDALLVRVVFGKAWLPWDYLNIRWREIDWRDGKGMQMGCILLAASLPFIWAGVVLTLKRLRSAGIAMGWAWMFFIPYLNMVLFALLCLAPEKEGVDASRVAGPVLRFNRKLWGNVLVVVVVCAGLVIFSVKNLQNYGLGLFVGIPFLMGFLPALLSEERGFWKAFSVSLIVHGCIGLLLVALAFEGIVCLIMAAPLSLTLSAFGVLIGNGMRRMQSFRAGESMPLLCAGILVVPVLWGVEGGVRPEPKEKAVSTWIEIDAPPERVWKHVISCPPLAEPQELLFRSGIAYPIRAEIKGTGVGALRYCVFSTGAFVEPIEVWKEPELLRFRVSSNPPPMKELSPYRIDPPHLHGFLVSNAGEFRLSPNGRGGTRVEGTTWYEQKLYPELYWRLWSDYIIHKIHLRVLEQIKLEAER